MHKSHNRFLLTISFISGMCIMGLELSAARILAPYFGTSQFVWTNIIGIVLLALSLGYYYGGKFSDKHKDIKYLLYPLLISGLIFYLIPIITEPISSFVTVSTLEFGSSTIIIFIASLIVTILLFAFPIFLLGTVSPYVIRLYKTGKSHLGEMAGSIFALSTLGSILGTFLPPLVLIPSIGTKKTIYVFASLLIAISLFGLLKKKHKILIVFVFLMPFLISGEFQINTSREVIAQTESGYQLIHVQEKPNGNRYLVFNEGGGVQSIYNPNSFLSNSYYDYLYPLLKLNPEQEEKTVAILGLAGGTFSRGINHYFPENVEVDGVEIDPKVIEIGKKYFELEQENLNIYNQDGTIFLRFQDKKYDLIVVDAYSNQLYIPWTMTTIEFWQLVKESLTEKGIVAINVNAISEDAEILTSISNTMAKAFGNVYITKAESDGLWNYMVMASIDPIPLNEIPQLTEEPELKKYAQTIAKKSRKIDYDPGIPLLTNDKAPIEHMTESMIFEYIFSSI